MICIIDAIMFEEVGLDVAHLYSGDDLMQRSKVFFLINKY